MTDKYPDKIKALPIYNGRFDAYQLKAQGCDVLFASYPAGKSIPAHSHDTDNHGVVLRGELILGIDGEVTTISAGQWYPHRSGLLSSREISTSLYKSLPILSIQQILL